MEEIGLKSGATVRCKHIRKLPYELKILVPSLSRTIELRRRISMGKTTVGELRSVLQNRIGLPVSMFRIQQKDNNQMLFDNHSLACYGINVGDTLLFEVWEGTDDFVVAAMSGAVSNTISSMPSQFENLSLNLFCSRVALFIAAHFDNLNLATELLQRGIR